MLMLLLPLIDSSWQRPQLHIKKYNLIISFLLISATGLVLVLNPDYTVFAFSTLLLAAIPEEWFFRAYFMQQLESIFHKPWTANIVTSALFSLLHFPTQGWFALTIILPSLVFGYVYQATRDLVLVILLHALSNIIFMIYISSYINTN